MEHILVRDLKQSILQAAISGKLSEYKESDTPIEQTLIKMNENRCVLFNNKICKNTKPTKEIDDIELFDIPEHWSWVQLADVGTLTRGSGIQRNQVVKNGYPCIRYGEMYTTYKDKINEVVSFVSKEVFDNCHKVKPGDIVMALTGENNFDIALAAAYLGIDEIAMGGDMTKWSNHYMNPEYLVYVMNSEYGISCKRRMAKGDIIVHISNDKLANIMLPLPPVEEQQRIVDKVKELMTKIDEYKKIENNLVQLKEEFPGDMRDAILQAAFEGKLTKKIESDSNVFNIEIVHENIDELEYEVPKTWSCAKMINISTIITGNSIPEAVKKSKYMNIKDGYNYIGTKDIGFNHEIAYENGVKIPYDELNFRYSEPGSTLLCIEGGSAGKKIAMTKEKVCYGNKLCSFYTEKINKKYLYYFIQSPQFSNTFVDNLSGMIGGVSINKIKEIYVPLPSIEEQQRIVDLLDKVLPLCDSLQSL